jgi:hypothetical protein
METGEIGSWDPPVRRGIIAMGWSESDEPEVFDIHNAFGKI